MGNRCSSAITISNVEPPTTGTRLTSAEVRQIIKEAFNLDDAKIFVGDKEYLAYSLDKLNEFLEADLANKLKYRSEVIDCDDFARILQGREREWFAKTTQKECGSTLGCVWGDLRENNNIDKPYYHAMNFFIDSERRLFMVEPQTDELRVVTKKSTHWFAEV